MPDLIGVALFGCLALATVVVPILAAFSATGDLPQLLRAVQKTARGLFCSRVLMHGGRHGQGQGEEGSEAVAEASQGNRRPQDACRPARRADQAGQVHAR